MALSLSQFPFCPSPKTGTGTGKLKLIPNPTIFASKPLKFSRIAKASRDEKTATDLGMEIKERGDAGFLSGVAEEIREIEWPAFNKVLGTTGLVMGVIAGSSVVLLTLNAVLAQISDWVFAGMAVQDFFR